MWSQKIQIQIIISKNLKLKTKRISDRQRHTGRPSGLTRRTVRGSPHGLSARVIEARRATGYSGDHPHRGAEPSACLENCPQVRCGLSARATCRRGQGRGLLSQVGSPFLLKPDHSLIYLPLSCSLSRKEPSWGFWLELSSNRPSTFTKSPPCHPGILSNLSLVYSDFEQEGG
jgi:hypothetical protein